MFSIDVTSFERSDRSEIASEDYEPGHSAGLFSGNVNEAGRQRQTSCYGVDRTAAITTQRCCTAHRRINRLQTLPWIDANVDSVNTPAVTGATPLSSEIDLGDFHTLVT